MGGGQKDAIDNQRPVSKRKIRWMDGWMDGRPTASHARRHFHLLAIFINFLTFDSLPLYTMDSCHFEHWIYHLATADDPDYETHIYASIRREYQIEVPMDARDPESGCDVWRNHALLRAFKDRERRV